MPKFKICPSCKQQVSGCRTRYCPNPNCQYEFIGKLTYGNTETSLKVINACKNAIDEYNKGNWQDISEIIKDLEKRTIVTEKKVVNNSNFKGVKFTDRKKRFNNPTVSKEPIDWHTLERGDIIKVSRLGGSVWINNNGEEIPMGDYGNFRVISHDAKGIHCHGLGKKSGVFYIHMGDEEHTKSGIIRRPHTILKVKKFIKIEEEED